MSLPFLVIAQNSSLNNKDTVDVLSDLCWKYRASNPRLALQYGYNALEIINSNSQFNRLAKLYNLIGVVYRGIVQYPTAQKYFLLAKEYAEKYNDSLQLGFAYNNLGSNLYYLYQYNESYFNCLQALQIFKKINNNLGISFAYHSLVLTFIEMNKLKDAKKYNNLFLQNRFSEKDSIGISKAYSNYVRIYLKENKYDSASINLKLAMQFVKNENNLGYFTVLHILSGDYYLARKDINMALKHYRYALELAKSIKYWDDLSNVSLKISKVFEKQKKYDSSLAYHKIYIAAIDSLDSKYSLASVFDINEKYEIAKQRKIEQLEREREKVLRGFLITIISIIGIAFMFIYRKNKIISKQKEQLEYQKEEITKKNEQNEQYAKMLEVQNRIIQSEKERADMLLYSVFPTPIADELKQSNFVKPRYYEEVSVMFIDMVDFTKITSRLTPEEVVGELSEIYSQFDQIINKHGAVKIKSIGDAYLIATGIPEYIDDHACRIVKVALEIFEYLTIRNLRAKVKWQLRAGIHTGELTAGIVGITQLTYDIWGDTVNLASRLEHMSEPFKINVSESVKDKLCDKYQFEERGELPVKGKGKMKMYFLSPPL